jgi:hypothetical protein
MSSGLVQSIGAYLVTGFNDTRLVPKLVGEPIADKHLDVWRHSLCVGSPLWRQQLWHNPPPPLGAVEGQSHSGHARAESVLSANVGTGEVVSGRNERAVVPIDHGTTLPPLGAVHRQ